jgi:hypothetical protein
VNGDPVIKWLLHQIHEVLRRERGVIDEQADANGSSGGAQSNGRGREVRRRTERLWQARDLRLPGELGERVRCGQPERIGLDVEQQRSSPRALGPVRAVDDGLQGWDGRLPAYFAERLDDAVAHLGLALAPKRLDQRALCALPHVGRRRLPRGRELS